MIVLIRANNRIEYCVVKKKDYDKRLFKHRGQLYAILPEDLRKLDFYIEDPEKKYSDVLNLKSSNECIIFNEGA